MNLGELIALLEAMDPDAVLPIGFRDPHSWRGSYDELAFEPYPDVPVSDMLAAARSALGATYQGYKGGEYEMGLYTPVHLSFQGASTDYWAAVALSPDLARAAMNADEPWAFGQNFPLAALEAGAPQTEEETP